MKIYLARNNVQAGPYTLDELNRMLSSGEVLLDDLMWHTGMSDWQRVGQMTAGRSHYQPQGVSTPPPPPTATPSQDKPTRGFGDNVDFNPPNQTEQQSDASRRVSVAELYGRAPTTPAEQPIQTPTTPKPAYIKARNQPVDDGKLVYASVGARFVAFAINLGLYIVALMPLMIAFSSIMDINEFSKISQTQDFSAIQEYSKSLAEQVPSTTRMVSNLMLFALLGIQLLLILMRGQSFGKLVMGIRVVDKNTHNLARLGTLLMRTFTLIVLYLIGSAILSGLPAIAMLVSNYVMAARDEHRQGWHDKMTGTYVVKARPSQLDKTSK